VSIACFLGFAKAMQYVSKFPKKCYGAQRFYGIPFCVPKALSYSSSVMEVSAKGSGWGGGEQDEGGRWVGRKKGSRWVGVGKTFPRKNLGSGSGFDKLTPTSD
jgi:hypothetical protein